MDNFELWEEFPVGDYYSRGLRGTGSSGGRGGGGATGGGSSGGTPRCPVKTVTTIVNGTAVNTTKKECYDVAMPIGVAIGGFIFLYLLFFVCKGFRAYARIEREKSCSQLGHPLEEYTCDARIREGDHSYEGGVTCDVCNNQFDRSYHFKRCRQCDLDLCASCAAERSPNPPISLVRSTDGNADPVGAVTIPEHAPSGCPRDQEMDEEQSSPQSQFGYQPGCPMYQPLQPQVGYQPDQLLQQEVDGSVQLGSYPANNY